MHRLLLTILLAVLGLVVTPGFGIRTLGTGTLGAGERYAALPATTPPVEHGGAARPISAWLEFCARYETECTVDLAEPERITLTPAIWRLVSAVNREVNRMVIPVTDFEHWGVVDRWDLAEDGMGDCEDIQLLKRQRLVAAGLPRRALRMTVALDENDEGHAVLMLRTDRGDLILDNKTDAVLPWQRTPYIYVKRESQDSLAWVSLNRLTGVTTTATRR